MFALLCLLSFLAVGGISSVASLKHNTTHGPPYNPFNSTYMALSIIARQQGIMTNNTTPSSALEAGIVQKAFSAWSAYYGMHPPGPQIQEHLDRSTASAAKYMASTIDDVKNWPLDRLSNGNAMLSRHEPANADALAALRDSIHLNQRNQEDGLWYWESYPEWSYLDGMYSLGPFLALDHRLAATPAVVGGRDNGNVTADISPGDDTELNDLHLQFRLLWDHCYNSTTGLLVHGYDASRTAVWASRTSGASGIAWGRSLGWFMMALVDTLEVLYGPGAILPAGSAGARLLDMYQRLAVAIMGYVDKRSGGWFQVVDMAGREGNYIESSGTAMFSYALLKGARLRYLDPPVIHAAQQAGRAAHFLLASEFVTREADGTLGFNGTVGVCSLKSPATYDVSAESNVSFISSLSSSLLANVPLQNGS